MNLVQVFAGLVIFLLFCTAFYLFSGQDAGMLWSIVITIMKASVLPVTIYVLNYSVLVPRLFFSGRRLLFYLINLTIVLLSVFLAVIFMDMPNEIDMEQLKQQINGFSLFRLLAGSLILKAMLYFCMAVLPIGVRYVTKWSEDREKLEEERRLAYVAFTRAKDRLFLSDAAGTNYDGSFRYPSRFLFNAEKENLDYAVPLDPDLVEDALEHIRKTENLQEPPKKQNEAVGKRVRHPVFGEGKVIGVPRGQEGYIVQFDNMVTPRTFGATVKLQFLK